MENQEKHIYHVVPHVVGQEKEGSELTERAKEGFCCNGFLLIAFQDRGGVTVMHHNVNKLQLAEVMARDASLQVTADLSIPLRKIVESYSVEIEE